MLGLKRFAPYAARRGTAKYGDSRQVLPNIGGNHQVNYVATIMRSAWQPCVKYAVGDTRIVDYSLPAGLHALTLVNEEKNLKTSIEVEVAAGKTTVND